MYVTDDESSDERADEDSGEEYDPLAEETPCSTRRKYQKRKFIGNKNGIHKYLTRSNMARVIRRVL